MGSLLFQFKSCIDGNYSPGADKHSCKRNKSGKIKIFSASTRKALMKFSGNLVNYLNSNYPDVKKLKDIKIEYIENFLIDKSKICSPYTIGQYKSYLRTLEKLIKQHYHFTVKLYPNELILPVKKKRTNKIREIYMRQEDIDKVLNLKSNSKCMIGLRFADLFGLRVSEICSLKGKDIDLTKNILHIHESKGKRSRNLPIDNILKLSLCQEVKSKVNDNDRVCPVRENTLNKFLSRKLISLNITRYQSSKTGVHSIRKKVAKDKMKEDMKLGMTKQQAMDDTSKFLGHNKNRNSVINTYVKSK